MALVQTTQGLLESDSLTVKDTSTIENDVRVTSTEWFLGEQLVRKDLNLNILCGQSMSGVQEQM
jgi:hypothetical protein